MLAHAVIKSLAMRLKQKEANLVRLISGYQSAVVAFSGGVDSSYLAFIANRVLGKAARVVTALSPSVSDMQRQLATDFAIRYHLNHQFIETNELENADYSRNTANRCYFCKSELFTFLARLRQRWGVEVVFDGSNADDMSDYRPGQKAAQEEGVVSPLVEAGITKEELRTLSKNWGLPTWDLPAMPCLSSRLPYGVKVTPDKLRQVEKAEKVLWDLGFKHFRVRHHEELARIEIARPEMERLMDLELFDRVNREFRSIGYHYVTLDLQGFRSGSLNELLKLET